jgi:hypothetical protein
MKKINLNKLLIVFISLGFVYFLGLGFFNKPALDDCWYYSTYLDEKNNLLNYLQNFRTNWQCRFMPQIMIIYVLKLFWIMNSFIIYYLLLITGFLFSFYRLFKTILINSAKELVLISMVLTISFLFVIFELSTFYWINVSTMYLAGTMFGILLFAEIFNASRRIITFVLLILSAIYAGSSAEHFSALLVMVLGILLLTIALKNNFKHLFSSLLFNKLLIAFVFTSVAGLIMLSAPGNQVRMEASPERTGSLLKMIEVSFAAVGRVGYNIFLKLPYWILLGLIWISIIKDFKFRNSSPILSKKNFLFIILIIVGILYLFNLPTVYATSTVGPRRAQAALTLFLFLSFIFLLVILHRGFPKLTNKLAKFSFLAAIILILLTGFRIYKDMPKAYNYAKSEESRLSFIRSSDKNNLNEVLTLKPLPVVWFFESAELFDVGYNNYFCKTYGITRPLKGGLEFKQGTGYDLLKKEAYRKNDIDITIAFIIISCLSLFFYIRYLFLSRKKTL